MSRHCYTGLEAIPDLNLLAQPALKRFGQTEVERVTLGLYNTDADIGAVVQSLWRLTAAR